MFNEVQGMINNSKLNFSEKVDDAFGDSIVQEVYEPIEKDLQNLLFAWDESEMRRIEINALLMELRTIL